MSRGWTIIVEARPADRPAMVSMEAGLRPLVWFFAVIGQDRLGLMDAVATVGGCTKIQDHIVEKVLLGVAAHGARGDVDVVLCYQSTKVMKDGIKRNVRRKVPGMFARFASAH